MPEELVKEAPNKIMARKNEMFIVMISIFMGVLLGSVAGWFSVYSSSVGFLFLFFALLFLGISFYKPLWGLFILMGFFLSPTLFYTEEVTFLEIFWGMLFIAGFIGSLLRALLARRKLLLSFKKETILWLALFFLIWLAASLLLSFREGETIAWWLRQYVDFIGYFLVFWVVWSIGKKNRRWIRILVGLFLIIGVAKGFQQLIYYFHYLPEAIASDNLQILRGRFFAEFFVIPGPILAICLYIHSKKRTEKLLFAFLTLFFLILLVLSFTRGLWVGFLVSFLVLLFSFKSFRAKITAIMYPLFIVTIVAIAVGFFLR